MNNTAVRQFPCSGPANDPIPRPNATSPLPFSLQQDFIYPDLFAIKVFQLTQDNTTRLQPLFKCQASGNLLILLSGSIAIVSGEQPIQLTPGDTWLVEHPSDLYIVNTHPHLTPVVITIELQLPMLIRIKHRYSETLIRREPVYKLANAILSCDPNRGLFPACELSEATLTTLKLYMQSCERDLINLKLEEWLLLKIKNPKGDYLAAHILNRCDPIKEKYREFLESNLFKGWSLAAYAKHAGMSLTSFKVMFSQVISHSSPKAWINERRLGHADKLLRTTRKRLAIIATESGFSSQSYFTQCYKTRYGRAPSETRHKADLCR